MGTPSFQFVLGAAALPLALSGCGPAQDEAMEAGKTTADFPQSAADYFAEMDGGEQFTEDEIKGRNTWMVWTGGNEAFWDYLANNSLGTFDLLKTISSFPCSDEQHSYLQQAEGSRITQADYAPASDYDGTDPAPYGGSAKDYYEYYDRSTRFRYLGLMNEPRFRRPTAPDEHGLCLDEPVEVDDPFDPEVYGYPSGVLGLRLYPNPNFDDKGGAVWDPLRLCTDPDYYQDRELVRPYRVGMACSFCHVSFHPNHPPADPENPEFENLSGTIMDCWNEHWAWTQTEEFKSQMTELVMQDDFLEDNYLSTDARIPVTLLDTKICSSMASNAIEGRVWDNFSSQTYKELPGMGELTLTDPVSGEPLNWQSPAGGRGYQRVPSLVSIWSTAQLKELIPELVALSSCPDYGHVERGHTFGSELPDGDKEALIAYLKTL